MQISTIVYTHVRLLLFLTQQNKKDKEDTILMDDDNYDKDITVGIIQYLLLLLILMTTKKKPIPISEINHHSNFDVGSRPLLLQVWPPPLPYHYFVDGNN